MGEKRLEVSAGTETSYDLVPGFCGLQAAATSIQHAISGMESVAKAVETLAKALDFVATLIPA